MYIYTHLIIYVCRYVGMHVFIYVYVYLSMCWSTCLSMYTYVHIGPHLDGRRVAVMREPPRVSGGILTVIFPLRLLDSARPLRRYTRSGRSLCAREVTFRPSWRRTD